MLILLIIDYWLLIIDFSDTTIVRHLWISSRGYSQNTRRVSVGYKSNEMIKYIVLRWQDSLFISNQLINLISLISLINILPFQSQHPTLQFIFMLLWTQESHTISHDFVRVFITLFPILIVHMVLLVELILFIAYGFYWCEIDGLI